MSERDRVRGASGSVSGSGCGGSKGSVLLIVRNGSAAAVVGGVSRDSNCGVCGGGGARRRQQGQRPLELWS